jgi:hypothetical protein
MIQKVHNFRRSHPGLADRKEWLHKIPHFIYHFENEKHKKCVVCSNQKGSGGKHIFTVRYAQMNSHVSTWMFQIILSRVMLVTIDGYCLVIRFIVHLQPSLSGLSQSYNWQLSISQQLSLFSEDSSTLLWRLWLQLTDSVSPLDRFTSELPWLCSPGLDPKGNTRCCISPLLRGLAVTK